MSSLQDSLPRPTGPVTYTWANGAQTRQGVSAEIVAKTVERIVATEGVCHPRRFWEVSTPNDAPTHPLFDWNVRRSAEQWWTHQARRIINSVVATHAEAPDKRAPAFVHVQQLVEDDEGLPVTASVGYVNVREGLMEHGDAVVNDVLRALVGWRTRYAALAELAEVWAAIDEAAEAVLPKRRRPLIAKRKG